MIKKSAMKRFASLPISAFVLASMVAFPSNAKQIYDIPTCPNMVTSGVWWPDLHCSRDALRRSDNELNAVWSSLKAKNRGKINKYKVEEQKHWIVRTRNLCINYAKTEEPQDFYEYNLNACLNRETKMRTLYLKRNF